MSHDIRSPLSSLISVAKGYSGLSKEESFKLIESIGNYLLEFVNCLLLSLQAESSGTSIKVFHEYFKVSDLLGELKAMMSPMAFQKQTTISVECSQSEMMITDKTKLTQIIVNFIGNSIKFTSKGRITLKFERVQRSLVKFSVIDTGIGMSPEAKKKLFLPFHSFGHKSIYNTQGVGLGIPLHRNANQ